MVSQCFRLALIVPLFLALLATGCVKKTQPTAEPEKTPDQPEPKVQVRVAVPAPIVMRVEERPEPVVQVEVPDELTIFLPRSVVAAMCGVPSLMAARPAEKLSKLDLALDSDLSAAVEVEKEATVIVEVPAGVADPVGLPDGGKDFESATLSLGSLGISRRPTAGLAAVGLAGLVDDNPSLLGGTGGIGIGGGTLATPGMQCRYGATKEKLLRTGGGSDLTEAAVARALMWLAKQQNIQGYWEFDGSSKDRVAATGMCLLPFLASGETHKTGKKYRDQVARGLNYLKSQIRASGQFGTAGMYSQAIATMAVCEACSMTRDPGLKNMAQAAVQYIVKAQAADGSWGYVSGTAGDTSIVGWQIQALKSARLADIAVPQVAFDNAIKFLESVSGDEGATYGYRTKGTVASLTAVGLLCRQFTGWTPRNPSLRRGTEYLWEKSPPIEDDLNIYYYYYATQVFHNADGPAWHKNWNPLMQKILLAQQITDKTPGTKAADIGSWPKDSREIGSHCGKLGTTAMACLTLEVYYRHLPLYKRDDSGLKLFDKKD